MKAKPKATRERAKKKAKAFTGIQALLLFPSGEDHKATLDLMRRFSAAARYAYNRLLEGWSREALKRENGPLCVLFCLNTRYADDDDAVMKAQAVLDSARELGEDPRKVVFGGRGLFEQLEGPEGRPLPSPPRARGAPRPLPAEGLPSPGSVGGVEGLLRSSSWWRAEVR